MSKRNPHPPEVRERAAALRAEGKTVKQVSEEIGVPRSTVGQWFADPAGEKARARHELARGVCKCGAPTSWAGREPSPMCRECRAAAQTKWTRDTIVAALQRFAARYGRPPTAPDWNPAFARSLGHDWRSERFHADGDYPNVTEAQRVFGSWSAAVAAAGFPSPRVGVYERTSGTRGGAHLERERIRPGR